MKPRKSSSGRAGKAQSPEPGAPNDETVEAMEDARRGKLVTAGSVDDLLAELNHDD